MATLIENKKYLKKIFKKISIEEQLKEFYRCRLDIEYFISTYIEIEEVGGNVNLQMHGAQKRVLKSILEKHYVIMLKSRQVGMSTIIQAYITWVCTFYKNITVGLVSKDGAEATDFAKKVMSMIKTLPPWMRPKFTKDTEQTFMLDNGCKFYSSQVNSSRPESLFRGKSVTIAVLDEAAHCPYIDEAYTGFGPTLFKAHKVAKTKNVPFSTIVISTPNKTIGIGGWFYKLWCNSQQENSLFKPEEIHWKDIPEFRDDTNWYKQQCLVLGNDLNKIRQELDMQFLSSTNSFFDADTVEDLNTVAKEPINKIRLEGELLFQYRHFNSNKFYLIGIDTATAYGEDFSAIQVIDYETCEQVAEFRSKLRVDDFCKIIEKLYTIFPRSLLIPESNACGNQVVEYFTKRASLARIYIPKKNANSKNLKRKYKYGISTSAITRPLIIDSLYTYIKEKPDIIKSKRTILELIGLITKTNGRVEADVGNTDDLAMAFAFCTYVRMYDPPAHIASKTSVALQEDALDIARYNLDEYSVDPINLADIRDGDSLALKNKKIQEYIKKNSKEPLDISKLVKFSRG